MGTICWAHNRRYNRREHKHYLRIFCRHHSSRTENQILWMGECGCRCRHRHWPNFRRITCQVWLFCTHVFWSNHNFIECCLWILFMPESLDKNNRLKEITFVRLNPFIQLANILSMKNLKDCLSQHSYFGYPTDLYRQFFTIYNGYFQLEACPNRTYVFNHGLPRYYFTRFHHAKAFAETS